MIYAIDKNDKTVVYQGPAIINSFPFVNKLENIENIVKILKLPEILPNSIEEMQCLTEQVKAANRISYNLSLRKVFHSPDDIGDETLLGTLLEVCSGM